MNAKLSYFLMIIVVFVWGISWPIGRIIALSDFGGYPFTISFIRYAFALPVLFFFTRLIEKEVVFPRHPIKNEYSRI